MANKPKAYAKKKNSGTTKLKVLVAQMIQKSLLLGKKSYFEDEEVDVPEDVKEGHFAVIAAVDDYKFKRFVVPLSYLTHQSFLRLLEQAEEEYGFDHEGALTIPCSPSEFERLLEDEWAEESGDSSDGSGGGNAWSSFNKTMVIKSC